jgi:hypothetical protein
MTFIEHLSILRKKSMDKEIEEKLGKESERKEKINN